MRRALIAIGAFCAMEPATYLAHRFVMHGAGWVLHRSHHEASGRRLQANDAFPVMFAGTTILGMLAGTTLPSLAWLVPAGAGVTAYGAAYGFVHDVYIHRRLGRLPEVAVLERLRTAHRVHHMFGEEPYGMLAPVVPGRLRRRVALLDAATGGQAAVARGAQEGQGLRGDGPPSTALVITSAFSVPGTRARAEKTS